MDLDIDFVAYMWVIGTILVLVVLVGGFFVGASFLERNRRREESRANSSSLRTWDGESPNSLGHR